MDLVESEYISLIAPRLERFKRVKHDLYNFRCPKCGDSKKNKGKSRGYFYQSRGGTRAKFKCHNCGHWCSFSDFLKDFDTDLYRQYRLARFREYNLVKSNTASYIKRPLPAPLCSKAPIFKKKFALDLPKASTDITAKAYLEGRKIDPEAFYYTPTFKAWANSQKPNSFRTTHYDSPRIIIPLVNQRGEMFGFQGRSLEENDAYKYITIMLNNDNPKIFGLDSIDPSKRVYVLEGPFDSTFIENSVAMCGADVTLPDMGFGDVVYVYDNEPRNKEICSRIKRKIKEGKKVVIFPSEVTQKDINNMVLAGHDVMSVLECNTFHNLAATLKFSQWNKL